MEQGPGGEKIRLATARMAAELAGEGGDEFMRGRIARAELCGKWWALLLTEGHAGFR